MRPANIYIKLILLVLISQMQNSFSKIVTFENLGTGQALTQTGNKVEQAINKNQLNQKWQLNQILHDGKVVYSIQNYESKKCIRKECSSKSCGVYFSLQDCNGSLRTLFYILGNGDLTIRNNESRENLFVDRNGKLNSDWSRSEALEYKWKEVDVISKVVFIENVAHKKVLDESLG